MVYLDSLEVYCEHTHTWEAHSTVTALQPVLLQSLGAERAGEAPGSSQTITSRSLTKEVLGGGH